ncbi:MAG TPA: SGNH/GDSL hydrolase family protein [Candidatus Hydrogenedentes bacterium]|nr:SGNH/GDSL hydrolase family protein [Candidatus Hydrogenedentota bacterium]HIJ74334.1 SGNH/GDSL hydrolase family protein [Candidatus Hydrogenedentota bacterium]
MGNLPKVLLLGDSIRMSYQPYVTRFLDGRALVVGPADNCQHTLYTRSSLARWIDELGEPDIVHWNNGIHDSGHNPERSPAQIPMETYRNTVAAILERLLAITPKVIWATTTPVHPERAFRDTEWSWRNAEIDAYNVVARSLMEANEVTVNDLHAVVWGHIEEYLSADQLHLSQAGQEACARAVAHAVSAHLPAGSAP